MTDKFSVLKNLQYAFVAALVSTIISILVLALALLVFGWGGYDLLDGVVHYLKYLPGALIWRDENIVITGVVFPIYITTSAFAGFAHLIYLADPKRYWSSGVFPVMFLIVVAGFWSHYLYFANAGTWLFLVGFVWPYIFVLLVIIAIIVRMLHVKLDLVRGRFIEMLALAMVAALLSGVFELIQLSGFD
jgi:hypothetical protein